MGEGEEKQKKLSLSSLILIVILIFYTILAPLFHKYRFHYFHESGICMIIGVIVSIVVSMIDEEVILIFTFRQILLKILSLMMQSFSHSFYLRLYSLVKFDYNLSAGYNINRRTFMKYFSYIFIFGVIGTIFNFLMVAGFTSITNSMGFFSFTHKPNRTEEFHEDIHQENSKRLLSNFNMDDYINNFGEEEKQLHFNNYSFILDPTEAVEVSTSKKLLSN